MQNNFYFFLRKCFFTVKKISHKSNSVACYQKCSVRSFYKKTDVQNRYRKSEKRDKFEIKIVLHCLFNLVLVSIDLTTFKKLSNLERPKLSQSRLIYHKDKKPSTIIKKTLTFASKSNLFILK